jgi:hypothetical protein
MTRIEQAIADLAALTKIDAQELADHARDMLIEILRRDPTLPPRSFLNWSIALAPAWQRIVDHHHSRIDEHVDREDVLRELRDEGLLDEANW